MKSMGHDHFGCLRDLASNFQSIDYLINKAEQHKENNPVKAINYLGRAFKQVQKNEKLSGHVQKGEKKLTFMNNIFHETLASLPNNTNMEKFMEKLTKNTNEYFAYYTIQYHGFFPS